MRIIFVTTLMLLLNACATPTPIRQNFPAAVPELMQPCDQLKSVVVQDDVPITDLLRVVTENYASYHVCRQRVLAWQEWYRSQRQISDSLR